MAEGDQQVIVCHIYLADISQANTYSWTNRRIDGQYAIGFPFCVRIALILCPDASVSIVKDLLKLGGENIGMEVKAC